MGDFVADFLAAVAGASAAVTTSPSGETITTYHDADGNFVGRSVALSGAPPVVKYYDADMELIGSTRVTVSNGKVQTEYIDPNGKLILAEKVSGTAEYTLTESYGPGWVLTGSVKQIHTANTTGEQVYDGTGKLISAHLEHDDGLGQTKIEDYGPNWALVSRTTIVVSGDKVTTEYMDASGVTGGTIVTTGADQTLTETFGPGWTLLGSVKEIHTATTTGTQTYDANDQLITAHLEHDDGLGQTKVEDYGPNWALISRTTITVAGDKVTTEHMDATGVTGGTIVTTRPDYTLTETFGAGWALLGSVKEIHTETTTGTQTYDAFDQLIEAHLEYDDGDGQTKVEDYGPGWTLIARTTVTVAGEKVTTEHMDANGVTGGTIVTTRADYTLTETFGAGWTLLVSVKEIHTPTVTGTQTYDANDQLISAHLETDSGLGQTKVEDFGPGWTLVARTTVTVAGDKVTTLHEDADGVIGGTTVITRPDYTLTETYGEDWVLLGAVKEIHTATTHGQQVYDADYNLLSAHLESDDGLGQTKVEDYGPGWALIARTTVTVSGNKVTTQIEDAGGITGGTSVTTAADYTLTETYGAGWVRLGAVKDIHSATTHGQQIYDANFNLISAHLETDNGLGQTKVEDYGPNWYLIARTTVTTTGDTVHTEHEANGSGNMVWQSTKVGTGVDAVTTWTGYGGNDTYVGDIGRDIASGNAGNDELHGMGNDDELYGGNGNDKLYGGAADDKLYGENGNDLLDGGSGSDTLNGGANSDTIIGGLGRDLLYGGAGNDRFVFLSAEDSEPGTVSRDQIKDFVKGQDVIDVHGVATSAGLANLTFVAAEGAAFTGVAGQLTYDQIDNAGTSNDITLVRVDTNGDGKADFETQVNGLVNFASSDFIL